MTAEFRESGLQRRGKSAQQRQSRLQCMRAAESREKQGYRAWVWLQSQQRKEKQGYSKWAYGRVKDLLSSREDVFIAALQTDLNPEEISFSLLFFACVQHKFPWTSLPAPSVCDVARRAAEIAELQESGEDVICFKKSQHNSGKQGYSVWEIMWLPSQQREKHGYRAWEITCLPRQQRQGYSKWAYGRVKDLLSREFKRGRLHCSSSSRPQSRRKWGNFILTSACTNVHNMFGKFSWTSASLTGTECVRCSRELGVLLRLLSCKNWVYKEDVICFKKSQTSTHQKCTLPPTAWSWSTLRSTC